MTTEVGSPAIIQAVTNSRLETLRGDWRIRAVEATLGNQTPLGTILLAVLGLQGGKIPRLGRTAEIHRNGHVAVDFWDENGEYRAKSDMGPIRALVDRWRKLADDIQATDADREAMFAELRKWFTVDQRVQGGRVNSAGELEAPDGS